MPQQADPDKVQARYADGCLLISVGKREASRPRSISVQDLVGSELMTIGGRVFHRTHWAPLMQLQ
jgi:Hsp20/alpha crystallin family